MNHTGPLAKMCDLVNSSRYNHFITSFYKYNTQEWVRFEERMLYNFAFERKSMIMDADREGWGARQVGEGKKLKKKTKQKNNRNIENINAEH
jgi:hypothetical protein